MKMDKSQVIKKELKHKCLKNIFGVDEKRTSGRRKLNDDFPRYVDDFFLVDIQVYSCSLIFCDRCTMRNFVLLTFTWNPILFASFSSFQ